MNYWLDIMGWTGTAILFASYFMRERVALHFVALIACALKLIYCYHHDVWPLFTNWAILVPVHLWQIHKLKERP
jgi:hypothetical protein